MGSTFLQNVLKPVYQSLEIFVTNECIFILLYYFVSTCKSFVVGYNWVLNSRKESFPMKSVSRCAVKWVLGAPLLGFAD